MEHLLQHGNQKQTPFEALLRRLGPQMDHAADRYEELRRKLVKFFAWSSCFPSEDLADETLDRMGRILLDRSVLDLEPFLWGVAKKIRRESQKHSEKIVAITDLPDRGTFLKDKVDVESEIHATEQSEVRSRCLRLCLNNMSQESRRVFLMYQGLHNKQQREQLASELGLTIGALRVRINRIKKQLQGSVQQCLASSASEIAATQLDGHGSRQNRLVAGPLPSRKRAA
jgi:DNA-directed RNA polymerase specialized sigma24 family protein